MLNRITQANASHAHDHHGVRAAAMPEEFSLELPVRLT
jgi:hypothetical protein